METIQTIADAILSAREFCGNEKEAAIDAAHDCGVKLTRELYIKALSVADNGWADYQADAGVTNPIHSDERAAIYKAIG